MIHVVRTQREAARFIVAVEALTGEEPTVTRGEPGPVRTWRIEVRGLTPNEAVAIEALIDWRVPPVQITRSMVAGQLDEWQRARDAEEAALAARQPRTIRDLTEREREELRALILEERARS